MFDLSDWGSLGGREEASGDDARFEACSDVAELDVAAAEAGGREGS